MPWDPSVWAPSNLAVKKVCVTCFFLRPIEKQQTTGSFLILLLFQNWDVTKTVTKQADNLSYLVFVTCNLLVFSLPEFFCQSKLEVWRKASRPSARYGEPKLSEVTMKISMSKPMGKI